MIEDFPIAHKYIEKFKSDKHKGYILISDVENVIFFTAMEAVLTFTAEEGKAKSIYKETEDKFNEAKRVFGL